VAAVDVGTNTTLMLIAARGSDGGLRVLADHCSTTRLGEGIATSGVLAEAAMERTLDCLRGFSDQARSAGVSPERQRLVSTAVLRRAADAQRFQDRVRSELGLTLEVLSESEEGRLAHRAVAQTLGRVDAVVIDVGGGSTEVVAAGGELRRSAPAGALLLTERYLGLDGRPARERGGWLAMQREVRDATRVFPVDCATGGEAVLLGGTGANLACLCRGAARFDLRDLEGTRLEARKAAGWAEVLQALPLVERLRFPIEVERAEILAAGLLCVGLTAERIGAERLTVSGRGLRYGVAAELLLDRPATPPSESSPPLN
jgi:exopolyphosphatase/guanosine-5'-triphosphate,3'-diphosphate pyrophosphatase